MIGVRWVGTPELARMGWPRRPPPPGSSWNRPGRVTPPDAVPPRAAAGVEAWDEANAAHWSWAEFSEGMPSR